MGTALELRAFLSSPGPSIVGKHSIESGLQSPAGSVGNDLAFVVRDRPNERSSTKRGTSTSGGRGC